MGCWFCCCYFFVVVGCYFVVVDVVGIVGIVVLRGCCCLGGGGEGRGSCCFCCVCFVFFAILSTLKFCMPLVFQHKTDLSYHLDVLYRIISHLPWRIVSYIMTYRPFVLLSRRVIFCNLTSPPVKTLNGFLGKYCILQSKCLKFCISFFTI